MSAPARGHYANGVLWPAPRPDATRVLVCFGFCGGGTSAFRSWVHAVPADVDLALVCLPGRERRIAEPPAQRWDDLMTEALTSLRSVVSRPYVLFGHSLGAWVAFDAAVHMEQSGGPRPSALVVSASNPPSRAARERRQAPSSQTSDAELLDWLCRVGQLPAAIVADPALCQLALDLFRADKRAAESYAWVPGTTVRCPMLLLRADDDIFVEPADTAWSALASGPYRYERLPGGHFYTPDIWAELPHHMGL
jgi:surfactin synthase thioesterase subunit